MDLEVLTSLWHRSRSPATLLRGLAICVRTTVELYQGFFLLDRLQRFTTDVPYFLSCVLSIFPMIPSLKAVRFVPLVHLVIMDIIWKPDAC